MLFAINSLRVISLFLSDKLSIDAWIQNILTKNYERKKKSEDKLLISLKNYTSPPKIIFKKHYNF